MTEHSSSPATQSDLESRFLVYVTWFAFVLCVLLPLVIFLVFYFRSGFKDNADDVQLFWLSPGILQYSERNSSIRCSLLDSEWHRYRFPVSTDSAPISKLRLDPVREFSIAERIELRGMVAGTSDTELTKIAIEGIECTACRAVRNGEQLSIDNLEFDPFVQISVVPPIPSATEFVQLELRIIPRRLGPLNWIMRRVETNPSNASCRSGIHREH